MTTTDIATYTPGPWVVEQLDERNKRELSIDSPFAFWIAQPSAGGEVVAVVEDVTIERGLANAYLVAAAPDLLVALKAMVASYDGLRDHLSNDGIVRDKLKAADAAIAKAEGRS